MQDSLSPSDLALLTSAIRKENDAKAVMSFVSQHIANTYKLDHTTLLNQVTGEIMRSVVSEVPATPAPVDA